jgi:FkbM family methyltransferase
MGVISTLKNILRETRCAADVAADVRSWLQLSLDAVLFRALKLGTFGLRNQERTVRLRDGIRITYRLNRGDIQGMREIWYDQVYRLPFEGTTNSIVDLGANIGLTSIYLSKRYGAHTIVAVEPDRDNLRLIRRNFAQNGIVGQIIDAAIGASDGKVRFAADNDSNLGRVSEQGREVDMISMKTLMERANLEHIDVLKMDIEGGEGPLLAGPTPWLSQVHGIIAEFHPDRIDYPLCVSQIERAGLRWVPPGSIYRKTTDCFVSERVQTHVPERC